MIIELSDRRIFCTPEEYREMLLNGLIGDGPIWTGNRAADTPPKFPDPEDKLCAHTMDDVERRIGEVNGWLHELESKQALVDLLEGHKSNWVPDSKGGEKNCFINEHFRALYMGGRK